MSVRFALPAIAAALLAVPFVGRADAADYDLAAHSRVVEKAARYLRTKGQAEDGSFTAGAGPGITAIVATGLLRNGISADDPLVAKSLKYLKGFVQDDGGIYADGSLYKNYETSMGIMCFNEANKQKPGEYDELLKRAERFVKGIQNDDDEGLDRSDTAFGGAGYGKHKRPDLSNTAFLLDALKSLGRGPEDEAVKNALIFVSRCQNLETENNDTKWASKNQDGGFYYTPAAGGSSQAKWPEGESEEVRGLRSYGSMTYVGLKSMIYAGVSKDDPRVKAATTWIRKNYSLDENPGLGKQGLFYYFQTYAKALEALGDDTFVDAKGVAHDWRAEMLEKLATTQYDDGSWVNEQDRWLEGDPNLVTGYALLALSHCRPKKEVVKVAGE
jgi:squalene-hopene/tetraprenyl-beta-curcumene cyclase